MVPAQAFIGAQQAPGRFRHILDRGGFARHHVLIEVRRTPYRLAGVIDDEVQAGQGGQQMPAEGLDTGRVAEVQAEDFQPVSPLREVRFRGIAGGRIAGEARADDQVGACTQ